MRVSLMALTMVLASPPAVVAQTEAVAGTAFRFKPAVDSTGVNQSLIISETRSISISWRCEAGAEKAMIIFNAPMVGDRSHRLTLHYNFDGRSPIGPLLLELATNNRVAFFPSAHGSAFTTRASRAPRVIIDITDPGGKALTDTISMRGLADALARLNGCR